MQAMDNMHKFLILHYDIGWNVVATEISASNISEAIGKLIFTGTTRAEIFNWFEKE